MIAVTVDNRVKIGQSNSVMKKTALFSETNPLFHLRRGFTLIELVVVISIIAILSTIALFGFSKAQASARDANRQATMNSVRSALERYYSDNQYYPGWTNWTTLVSTDLTGYITVAPIDPCQGGSAIINDATTKSGRPGIAGPVYYCGGIKYDYIASPSACTTALKTCTSYALTLTPEAGGRPAYFFSPQ